MSATTASEPQARTSAVGVQGTMGRSGAPWSLVEIPVLSPEVMHEHVLAGARTGGRLLGVWAWPGEAGAVEVVAVLAFDAAGRLALFRTSATAAFPSLTPTLPAAQAFERAIFESLALRPEGHPWLKPLIRHSELDVPGPGGAVHEFFRVDGPGVHEVAVGPVHAGIIEPGHFRFQCAGETVLHLEIQLGYQHRAAEALLLSTRPERRLLVAESIAGDTAIGHVTAHCEIIEALARTQVPARAQALRAIALELERAANHIGDLGALCGDVGYLPGASFFGRLRGDVLNLLLELSGNRFGRGLLVAGGVRFDLTESIRAAFDRRLAQLAREVDEVADLAFSNPSVTSRFEQTGPLPFAMAERLGLVGPAARASGCTRDVRADHPSGFYRFAHIPIAQLTDGDVLARALVRHIEAHRSIRFVREEIEGLPQGPLVAAVGPPAPDAFVIALVEGWRGEIAHVAVTDAQGRLLSYQVADPSVHNWFGLAVAMRGQQISDFPLCNKSFNLSYAGHDR